MADFKNQVLSYTRGGVGMETIHSGKSTPARTRDQKVKSSALVAHNASPQKHRHTCIKTFQLMVIDHEKKTTSFKQVEIKIRYKDSGSTSRLGVLSAP